MKTALIQLDIEWEDKEKNLSRIESFIKKAASDGCGVAVLPEMCITGFSMNTDITSELPNGPSQKKIAGFAEKYNINIIAGLVEKTGEKSANTAAVIDRTGNIIAKYAKNRLFDFAGEQKFHMPGISQEVFNIDRVPCSVFICYDLRFPELFRKVAKDVSVIFVIANWPAVRQKHWKALLKARAIENQCFIIGVNRTGTDGNGIEYSGGSAIFSPDGDIVSTPNPKEEYSVFEFDTDMVSEHRKKFPFL